MQIQTIIRLRDFVYDSVQTVVTLLRIFLLSRPVRKFPSASTSGLLILGNGPSLKNFLDKHADFASGKTVLGVNQMAASPVFEQMKPSMYVVSAPEYWLEDVEDDYKRWKKELFESLRDKTTWNLNFFIPVAARKNQAWQKILAENPRIKIYYYNNTPVEGFKSFRYNIYNRRLGIPRPHNVMIPSLMIGILAGYKNIYLTGIDHNWLKSLTVGEDNTVYLIQEHFYDNANELKPAVMKKLGKGARKMHEILEKFMLAFRGYHEINGFARSKNVKIYNLTPGSFVDAFERMRL
jgi:hypothetical protein